MTRPGCPENFEEAPPKIKDKRWKQRQKPQDRYAHTQLPTKYLQIYGGPQLYAWIDPARSIRPRFLRKLFFRSERYFRRRMRREIREKMRPCLRSIP